MNSEVATRVQKALEDRLSSIIMSEGPFPNYPLSSAVDEKWNECLGMIGARRISKLMGIVVGPEAGMVRFKDPLGHGGNHGFVEIGEETLDKVAALGLP